MSQRPATAVCRTVLADGSLATVTASARPRASRAEVKCIVAGSATLAMRMQQVVRAARLTEAACDSRDQVVIGIDRTPGEHERDWELAAVLADRMARGACPGFVQCANGWSDAWQLGRVDGHHVVHAPPGVEVLRGGAPALPYLGALHGHADPSASVSSARAWFPVHSGGSHDRLCWVEVSVCPRSRPGTPEEDSIAVPGVDAAMQHAVRGALCGARHFDGRGLGRWRTLVTFEEARLHGRSYELALVMADRLARGREFPAPGRLLASGMSLAWHAGRVDEVDGIPAKVALIAAEARRGDRVLLPAPARDMAGEPFAATLRERGASVAFIERIGFI